LNIHNLESKKDYDMTVDTKTVGAALIEARRQVAEALAREAEAKLRMDCLLEAFR
jgi:hypothetical protein